MLLIADAGAVIARRGDDEVEGLLAGSTGALGHDIKELPVWLTQKLVEDAGVDIVAVLAGNIRGQRLIDAAGGHVHQPLLRLDDFDALHQQVGLIGRAHV